MIFGLYPFIEIKYYILKALEICNNSTIFLLDINLTFSYTIQVPVTQQNTWRGVRAAEGA